MSKTIMDQLSDFQKDLSIIEKSIEKIKRDLDNLINVVGNLSIQAKNLTEAVERSGGDKLKNQILEKSIVQQRISSIEGRESAVNEKSPTITHTTIAERPIVMAYPAPTPSSPQKQTTSTQSELKQDIQTKKNDPKQMFDAIIEAAKNNIFARDIGKMIDSARSEISKSNSLNPILFELSMEAGRLKILGEKSLTQEGIDKLEELANKWKLKS